MNSAGFEPANFRSRGEHVTPRPPRPTISTVTRHLQDNVLQWRKIIWVKYRNTDTTEETPLTPDQSRDLSRRQYGAKKGRRHKFPDRIYRVIILLKRRILASHPGIEAGTSYSMTNGVITDISTELNSWGSYNYLKQKNPLNSFNCC